MPATSPTFVCVWGEGGPHHFLLFVPTPSHDSLSDKKQRARQVSCLWDAGLHWRLEVGSARKDINEGGRAPAAPQVLLTLEFNLLKDHVIQTLLELCQKPKGND